MAFQRCEALEPRLVLTPPVAVDESYTALDIAGSPFYVGNNEDMVEVEITQPPAHGYAAPMGSSIEYNADDGYSGSDTVKFKLKRPDGYDDGGFEYSNEATLFITVLRGEILILQTTVEPQQDYLPVDSNYTVLAGSKVSLRFSVLDIQPKRWELPGSAVKGQSDSYIDGYDNHAFEEEDLMGDDIDAYFTEAGTGAIGISGVWGGGIFSTCISIDLMHPQSEWVVVGNSIAVTQANGATPPQVIFGEVTPGLRGLESDFTPDVNYPGSSYRLTPILEYSNFGIDHRSPGEAFPVRHTDDTLVQSIAYHAPPQYYSDPDSWFAGGATDLVEYPDGTIVGDDNFDLTGLEITKFARADHLVLHLMHRPVGGIWVSSQTCRASWGFVASLDSYMINGNSVELWELAEASVVVSEPTGSQDMPDWHVYPVRRLR